MRPRLPAPPGGVVLPGYDAPVIEASQRTWRDWVGLAARLILGGALFYAGAAKVMHPDQSVLAVRAYQLDFIPYELQKLIGYGLPIFELMLGLLVLAGIFTRVTAATGALLMLVFIAGIASVWARGLSIDCGCFGGGGQTDDPQYFTEIIRDSVFALSGLWLVWRPRTPFSVDNWLFRPITTSHLAETTDLDDELVREDIR